MVRVKIGGKRVGMLVFNDVKFGKFYVLSVVEILLRKNYVR